MPEPFIPVPTPAKPVFEKPAGPETPTVPNTINNETHPDHLREWDPATATPALIPIPKDIPGKK